MALIAAKRIAVVAAMSAQHSPAAAAERAVAHALKDVLTNMEAAVQRAGRTKLVSTRLAGCGSSSSSFKRRAVSMKTGHRRISSTSGQVGGRLSCSELGFGTADHT